MPTYIPTISTSYTTPPYYPTGGPGPAPNGTTIAPTGYPTKTPGGPAGTPTPTNIDFPGAAATTRAYSALTALGLLVAYFL